MTLEFVVVFPVALVIALVGVNIMSFLSCCAEFDRQARSIVRIQASSPSYGQSLESIRAEIAERLNEEFDEDYLSCTVTVEGVAGGLQRYEMRLDYRPNLFGLGLREEFFGVSMPAVHHDTQLVVDPYKPGALF